MISVDIKQFSLFHSIKPQVQVGSSQKHKININLYDWHFIALVTFFNDDGSVIKALSNSLLQTFPSSLECFFIKKLTWKQPILLSKFSMFDVSKRIFCLYNLLRIYNSLYLKLITYYKIFTDLQIMILFLTQKF